MCVLVSLLIVQRWRSYNVHSSVCSINCVLSVTQRGNHGSLCDGNKGWYDNSVDWRAVHHSETMHPFLLVQDSINDGVLGLDPGAQGVGR